MTHPLSTLLKSALVCAALAASAMALALPSPKDIETAVSQGHLTQAESMLREVIAAKPQSAKAHYELAQVLLRENRASEAQAELKQAQGIDPTLKFASSDKQFQELMERTQVKPQAAQATSVQAAPQAPAQSGNGFSLTYVWIGIAALGVVALLMRMNRPASQPMSPAYASPASPTGSPLSTAFGRNPTTGYAPAPAGYPAAGYPGAAPSGGSTVAGAVVGGLAGVAAGYALSKALEGDHHPAPPAQAPASNGWADNQGLVSGQAAAPEFDAGTGSDWGDDSGGDSGGGSDDSW
jgi:hypothetical protein